MDHSFATCSFRKPHSSREFRADREGSVLGSCADDQTNNDKTKTRP